MARGSAISRVREYFKQAPLDEVEVVFSLIQKDVSERKRVVSKPAVATTRKRTRAPRAVAAIPPAPATAQLTEEEIA